MDIALIRECERKAEAWLIAEAKAEWFGWETDKAAFPFEPPELGRCRNINLHYRGQELVGTVVTFEVRGAQVLTIGDHSMTIRCGRDSAAALTILKKAGARRTRSFYKDHSGAWRKQ